MNFLPRYLALGWLTVLAVAGLLAAGPLPAPAQPPVAVDIATAIVLPPVNPPLEISITAKVPTAYAAAGIPGSFLLTLTGGSTLGDVMVSYQVGGQAVPGRDYKALKGTKTIPAGKSKVQININPLDVPGNGGTVKGVRVTLLAGDGYSISGAAKASVKIVQ